MEGNATNQALGRKLSTWTKIWYTETGQLLCSNYPNSGECR